MAKRETPAGTRPVRADVARNEARIIDAATRLLADRPGASMQEIADAAELDRATLYRHFRSREQLIAEIQRAGLAEVAEILEQLPSQGQVIPAICAALGEGIALGSRYRVVALAPRTEQDLFLDEAATAMPLMAALERGKRRGEVDREVDSFFAAALFAYTALAAINLIERTGASLDDTIAEAQAAYRKVISAA
jgi:AcrR family transcriptional regulator